MKRSLRLSVLAALFFVAVQGCLAQWVTVTANRIQNGAGGLLASGQFCVQPVDNNNHPLIARAGGSGGAIITSQACGTVTAGVLVTGFNMPDTSVTVPANVCLRVTIKDASQSGAPVYVSPCVQPSSASAQAYWCTTSGSTTCNFDLYNPSTPAQAVVAFGPTPAFSATATGLSPGAAPTASVGGTPASPVINLGIPVGATGATGATGANGVNGANGTNGFPAMYMGNWNIATTYSANQIVNYNGTNYVVLVGNTNVVPTSSLGTDWGPSPVPAINAVVQPDILASPTTAYATQATAISSVTDANAKTALTAINNSLLSMQTALSNNGVIVPNAIQAAIAGCAQCAVFLFNPTGAIVAPTTISNLLTDSNTATLSQQLVTGGPNFNPGGRAVSQAAIGYIQFGNCSPDTSNFLVPIGAGLGLQVASCGTQITSSSQVQGGGSLTTTSFPGYRASSTTMGTLVGTSGGTLSVVSIGNVWGNHSNVFSDSILKANEWKVGNGVCAEYNTGTSAYVTFTFPNTVSTPSLMGNVWTRTTLVDHGNGTFTCYLNDGSGSAFASPLQTATTTATAFQVQTENANQAIEQLDYFPGVQMTQQQIAALSCGNTAAASCGNWNYTGNTFTNNPWTTLSSQPGATWNTHTFTASDPYLHDGAYFQPFANGGTSASLTYNAMWAHTHAVVSTNAPQIRFGINEGFLGANNAGLGTAVHVDGVFAFYQGGTVGNALGYVTVALPNDGAFHTVDLDTGFSNAIGTGVNLLSGLYGQFLVNFSVPNNQQYTFAPAAQTGTTLVVSSDSILSGYNVLPNSAAASFVPMYRASTSQPQHNIALVGAASLTLNTFFNPGLTPTVITTAGGGSGFPTSTATTWVANNVAPLATGGTASNISALQELGTNDMHTSGSVYGGTYNCIGAYAYSLKNYLAAMKAYNPSMTITVMGIFNRDNYLETVKDGCTGDSYTTTTTLAAYEPVGGVWTSTSVPGGTVISGSSFVYQWRIVQQDICLTLGSCSYWETGPGAPGITAGGFTWQTPTLTGPLSTATIAACTGCAGFVTGDHILPTQAGSSGTGFYTVVASGGVPTSITNATSASAGSGYFNASAVPTTTTGAGTGTLTINVTIAPDQFNTDTLHLTSYGHLMFCQYFSAKFASAAMPCQLIN